ncbi:hypothetical protein ABT57_06220 [Photobacterium ganghwense]|uniref:Uncharacterized protein n=1 Tax=Photobacterium ganghwense TaxID=320778 RepID=A0A0J1HEU2_9GAMM|nr:hypothetical protein ABT57_06220 [Photobacterium ganghwense]
MEMKARSREVLRAEMIKMFVDSKYSSSLAKSSRSKSGFPFIMAFLLKLLFITPNYMALTKNNNIHNNLSTI